MSSNKINALVGEEHIKTLFSIFKNHDSELRLVGGSIRDLMMSRDASDIDSATTLEPNDVLKLLKKNNIEYDDFAIRYGSIIAYPNNKKIQITSLREDINQLGRHTSVLYTKDWKKDAARRDFTFNALYLGEDCKMYDYYKGHQHLQEKIINSKLINLKKNLNLEILQNIEDELKSSGISNIDYCEVRSEENLNISKLNEKSRLFIAFYLSKIRVIDNFILY